MSITMRTLTSALAAASALVFCAGSMHAAADQAVVAPLPLPVDTPPTVRKHLFAWESASREVRTYQATIRRMVQDLTFNVEKQSTGTFYFEAPNRWRVDTVPIRVGEGALSQNRNPKTNSPFELQADDAERWIVDGLVTRQIDVSKREVVEIEIPKSERSQQSWLLSWLIWFEEPFGSHFLCESAGEKMRRFDVEVREHGSSGTEYLRLEPRLERDRGNFGGIYVLLDDEPSLPRAIKFVDPAVSLETIYQFSDLHVNEPFVNDRGEPFDPFEYKLPEGYRLTSIKNR